MEGRSHLLMGATCAVVVDSVAHLSGPPLMLSHGAVPLTLIIDKGIFYLMVLLGSLLPDIDNAHSTMGKRFGWVSREIQHVAGHRTLCHSLLGLGLAAGAALCLEQLAVYLLLQRGLVLPAKVIETSHLVVIAGTFGALTHLLADGLTEGGVPLFWPNHKRYGFPPSRRWRFHEGGWVEHVVVFCFMFAVLVGIWQSVIHV